jgi:hypothetical protein
VSEEGGENDHVMLIWLILVPESSARARRLRHWLPFLQPEIGGAPAVFHVWFYVALQGAANFKNVRSNFNYFT